MLYKKIKSFSKIKFSVLIKWVCLILMLAIIIGGIISFFLWLLEFVTNIRFENTWLILFLPIIGVGIYYCYMLYGKGSEAGNTLIFDKIKNTSHKKVPIQMAPLVFITTVVTHLFGGSAGREGTAVQIGGSIANYVASIFKLSEKETKVFLMVGVAAGFGAVFGTPIAGAVFALEVLISRISILYLLPCLLGSVLANLVCEFLNTKHTQYQLLYNKSFSVVYSLTHIDTILLLKISLASICFGLVSIMFVKFSHLLKNIFNSFLSKKWAIPFVGGFILICLNYIFNGADYLGLGVLSNSANGVSIVSSFTEGGATPFSWFLKLLFTVFTLSSGFKGGEVTPLFFIGASLGNILAIYVGAPVDLFAALGFIAVFAGATKTPIASTIMGIELFGAANILYFGTACLISHFFSGKIGIYSQNNI